MQIGVNYLLESKELFEEGKIDFVDYFKLYSLNSELIGMDWCLKNCHLLFHGIVGSASSFGNVDLIKNTNIEETRRVLKESGSPYLSAHINTNNKEQTKEETLKAISDNVKIFKETFNTQIALENIPYRTRFLHCTYLMDPDVISQIVHENDCYFLFDISHARKAAEGLNIPFDEYVSRLPMDRVVEFHLAGMYDIPTITDGNRLQYTKKQIDFINELHNQFGDRVDYHGKLQEEDYEFLKEAVVKYKDTLKYITLEYGSYNNGKEMEDEAFTYPLCNYKQVNPVAKQEVLEQLERINKIIKNN